MKLGDGAKVESLENGTIVHDTDGDMIYLTKCQAEYLRQFLNMRAGQPTPPPYHWLGAAAE